MTGNVVEVIIAGTTAQQLNTSGDYATAAVISAITPYIPSSGILKYVLINNLYYGQITVNQDTGAIRIGYTRKIADGNPASIPADMPVYIKETFVIN